LSPSKHRPPTLFHRQNKTDEVVHSITKAKQYVGLGRAKPGQWIFQPSLLTWRSLVYSRHWWQAVHLITTTLSLS